MPETQDETNKRRHRQVWYMVQRGYRSMKRRKGKEVADAFLISRYHMFPWISLLMSK